MVYSVDIMFAMCTIKLKSMSCFITKFPTLIVWDIIKQATQFSVQCDLYIWIIVVT